MTRISKNISRLDKLSDDFCDVFTDMENAIADALGVEWVTVSRIVGSYRNKAHQLYLDETYGREKDKEEAENAQNKLERDLDDMRMIAISAKEQAPIVFTLHDDAVKYGWQDRDAEAWSIVTDIFAELKDMAAVHA